MTRAENQERGSDTSPEMPGQMQFLHKREKSRLKTDETDRADYALPGLSPVSLRRDLPEAGFVSNRGPPRWPSGLLFLHDGTL